MVQYIDLALILTGLLRAESRASADSQSVSLIAADISVMGKSQDAGSFFFLKSRTGS